MWGEAERGRAGAATEDSNRARAAGCAQEKRRQGGPNDGTVTSRRAGVGGRLGQSGAMARGELRLVIATAWLPRLAGGVDAPRELSGRTRTATWKKRGEGSGIISGQR